MSRPATSRPAQAGAIGRRAEVGRLVLTHFSDQLDPDALRAQAEDGVWPNGRARRRGRGLRDLSSRAARAGARAVAGGARRGREAAGPGRRRGGGPHPRRPVPRGAPARFSMLGRAGRGAPVRRLALAGTGAPLRTRARTRRMVESRPGSEPSAAVRVAIVPAMARRMQASEESPESAAGEQQHKHRRAVRVAKVLALGGVVALVTKDDLRSRLLDALFGPEEQFEYDSVTEPVAPGIEPQGTGMFRPATEEEEASDAEAPDDELWSIPTSDAEAAGSVSIANDPSAAGDETRYPGAGGTDTATEDPMARGHDSEASAYGATPGAYDTQAQGYEPAAPGYDAPAATGEAPADDGASAAGGRGARRALRCSGLRLRHSGGDLRGSRCCRRHRGVRRPPSGEDWPAVTYEAPAALEQAPAAAHDATGRRRRAAGIDVRGRGPGLRRPVCRRGDLRTGRNRRATGVRAAPSRAIERHPSVEPPSYEAPFYEAPSVEAPAYEAPPSETASYVPPASPYEYPVYDVPAVASDRAPSESRLRRSARRRLLAAVGERRERPRRRCRDGRAGSPGRGGGVRRAAGGH